MADNKVIEAEIVEENIQMKEMPEQPTKWERFKRFCKRHWKGAVIGTISTVGVAATAYTTGYHMGKKATTTSISNDDVGGYLDEGQNSEDYPEV